MKYTSCDHQKVVVTYEAADAKYKPINNRAKLKRVIDKYGLPSQFIMYVGSLSPRKNMTRLLQAFASIKDQIPHQLVLTGSKSWKDADVYQTIARLSIQDRIHKLGYVDEQDMPGLYNLAEAYIYPSLYEGFGLPVLEAMQCECPVIASMSTSIPEVAGDAAILFDPMDPNAMANAICQVLLDRDLREQLKVKGLARAKQFSWIKCAQTMWQTIRAIAGQNLILKQ